VINDPKGPKEAAERKAIVKEIKAWSKSVLLKADKSGIVLEDHEAEQATPSSPGIRIFANFKFCLQFGFDFKWGNGRMGGWVGGVGGMCPALWVSAEDLFLRPLFLFTLPTHATIKIAS